MLAISDLLLITTAGLAAACLLYAARHQEGRSRKAWTVLAVAMIFDTFGEASWAVIEIVLHQNPFPSVADFGYLMIYPLFAAGILLLPEVPLSPRERHKILLDAAIVIVSAALVFWVFLIGPIVASAEAITLDLVISAAYPVMDLVLFLCSDGAALQKARFSGTYSCPSASYQHGIIFDCGCSLQHPDTGGKLCLRRSSRYHLDNKQPDDRTGRFAAW